MQSRGSDEEVILLARDSNPKSELLNAQTHQHKPGYKDIAFAVIFVAQLLVVTGLALSVGIMALSNTSVPDDVDVSKDGSTDTESGANYSTSIIAGVFLLLLVGGVLSVFWVQIMIRLAAKLIMGTLIGITIVCVLFGVLFMTSGSVLGGALVLGAAAVCGVYAYLIRDRIEFASKNLKVACNSILSMPSTIIYALVMLAIQLLWCVIWSMAVLGVATNDRQHSIKHDGVTYDLDDCSSYTYRSTMTIGDTTLTCGGSRCHACVCDNGSEDVVVYSKSECLSYEVNGGLYFAMLISFYWTCCVISNVVHCVASGAVGSWWFHENAGATAVRDAFVRAVTTSFGSICFGSLLVAVVRALRQLVYNMKQMSEKSSWLISCAEFLLACLDKVLEYFSKYAFCYVALYGSNFIDSGKSVSQLFRQRGWTAIVNDDLIDNVLALGCFVVAIICTFIAYIFSNGVGLNSASTTLMCFFGLFIGYVMCMVTLQVVNSAVATVFVLFAEAPESFKYTRPELYDELVVAWTKFHGEEMATCGYANPLDVESTDQHYRKPSNKVERPVVKVGESARPVLQRPDSSEEGDEAAV